MFNYLFTWLFVDLKEAYIADSESSSIRAVDLRTGGSRSLAGGDPVFAENLFRVFLFEAKDTRFAFL